MQARVDACVGARETEARARGALVVPQAPVPRIGERRVREHELPRRERAGVRLGDARPIAEERDLHAVVAARGIRRPSR